MPGGRRGSDLPSTGSTPPPVGLAGRRPVRRLAAALAAVLVLGPAPAAAQRCGLVAPPRAKPVPGDSVVGTVRDAATGRPMGDVWVSGPPVRRARSGTGSAGRAVTGSAVDRPSAAWTDTAGCFVLRGLRPGRQVVTVRGRPYVTARRIVVVPAAGPPRAGRRIPVLNIALRRGPPPRGTLAGRWILEVTATPGSEAATFMDEPVRGTLAFRDTMDAALARGRVADPALFRPALGTFTEDAARAPSRPGEAEGAVFFGDSVAIRLGPRDASHPDFALRGRLTGNTARGVWEQQGPFTDGLPPAGRFVMRRVP